MKQVRKWVLLLLVLLLVVSCTVTVCAMSAETEPVTAPVQQTTAAADYAQEEMAVESYYQGLAEM